MDRFAKKAFSGCDFEEMSKVTVTVCTQLVWGRFQCCVFISQFFVSKPWKFVNCWRPFFSQHYPTSLQCEVLFFLDCVNLSLFSCFSLFNPCLSARRQLLTVDKRQTLLKGSCRFVDIWTGRFRSSFPLTPLTQFISRFSFLIWKWEMISIYGFVCTTF